MLIFSLKKEKERESESKKIKEKKRESKRKRKIERERRPLIRGDIMTQDAFNFLFQKAAFLN